MKDIAEKTGAAQLQKARAPSLRISFLVSRGGLAGKGPFRGLEGFQQPRPSSASVAVVPNFSKVRSRRRAMTRQVSLEASWMSWQESSDPLMLCVSVPDPASYEEAKPVAQERTLVSVVLGLL